VDKRFVLTTPGPHKGQPVYALGAALDHAQAALVMAHGRGASAEDMLLLAEKLERPGFIFLAPQAANNHWYPNRFSAALDSNEPWLTSALMSYGEVIAQAESAGIPAERILLLGFSQGACLALEYAARNPRRYGGVAGLAGSLIGPADTPRDYPGSLEGTPVFLGCSDEDPFIPKERVLDTSAVLARLGAQVTARLYPNLDHRINLDETHAVQEMMERIA
jgi:phospholipase/carboxylesterase